MTDRHPNQPALTHAIKTMPRWKWLLLATALVIGCIGIGTEAASYFKTPNAPVSPQSAQPAGTPSGSSGFVSGQPASTDVGTATTNDGSVPTSLWKMLMTRIGFSLFVGVVVGVIFRAFLRTALMITALIVGAGMALSYFHILNVDLTSVKADSTQATNWLTDQGYRLKDMLFHTLPSSTSASVGFFLGLKRR